MKAIYPFVGGTSNTNKFNLKDPRDVNAAFRLSFVGGWTFTNNGAQGSGSNNYADTFFNMASNLTFADSGFSIYFGNNGSGSHGARAVNPTVVGNPGAAPYMYYNGTNFTAFYWAVESSGNRVTTNTGPTSGFWSLSRTNSTQFSVYRNSGLLGSVGSGGSFPSLNFYLSATNDNGIVSSRSNSLLSFSALHTGLTSTESQLFYRIVEKYQVALGRNINAVLPFYYNSDYSIEVNNFIFNAGITDATQQSALNTLVNTLKTANIWTKMKAVYPMVGGNATSHRYNLVNTSNYLLTFNGGWTHSASGATPNGSTGYADTGLKPYGTLDQNSHHMSYYSRTNNIGTSNIRSVMGCSLNSQLEILSWEYPTGSNIFDSYLSITNSNYMIRSSINTAKGFLMANRQTSTNVNFSQSGVIKVSSTNSLSSTLPNITGGAVPANIWIGSSFRAATSERTYTILQCSFASIGDGLTNSELTTFYNAVQAFQTTLNRQV
jgi:hypothetical protein